MREQLERPNTCLTGPVVSFVARGGLAGRVQASARPRWRRRVMLAAHEAAPGNRVEAGRRQARNWLRSSSTSRGCAWCDLRFSKVVRSANSCKSSAKSNDGWRSESVSRESGWRANNACVPCDQRMRAVIIDRKIEWLRAASVSDVVRLWQRKTISDGTMQNPYEPGTPKVSEAAPAADVPASRPSHPSWRGARSGARVAAYIGSAIALLLITPALAVTAFAMASGRGFGVSSYFLAGIVLFGGLVVLGGLLGAGAGLIGSLLSGGKTSPEAEARIARQQLIEAARKRRPKRWPWAVGVPLLIVLAVAGIAGAYFGNKVDHRLAAAVAAADADDPNWRFDDLLAHRVRVPNNENSAMVLDEVSVALPENWPAADLATAGAKAAGQSNLEKAFSDLNETPANVRLSAAVVVTLRNELRTHDEALRLARTLANYRQGHHNLVIGPTVIDTLLPHVQRARTVARAPFGRCRDSGPRRRH